MGARCKGTQARHTRRVCGLAGHRIETCPSWAAKEILRLRKGQGKASKERSLQRLRKDGCHRQTARKSYSMKVAVRKQHVVKRADVLALSSEHRRGGQLPGTPAAGLLPPRRSLQLLQLQVQARVWERPFVCGVLYVQMVQQRSLAQCFQRHTLDTQPAPGSFTDLPVSERLVAAQTW